LIASLAQAKEKFVFPHDQDVADLAFGKSRGTAASASVEHGDVDVEFFYKFLRLGFVVVVLEQGPMPGSEKVPTSDARSFGIGSDDLHAGLDEVAPIFDAFGIAFAHEKTDGGEVGGTVFREAFLPIGGKKIALGVKCVDVACEGEGDDVGFETVDDGTGLFAGAAMGLSDDDGLAGFIFPVFGKTGVVFGVKLAGRVVGNVE